MGALYDQPGQGLLCIFEGLAEKWIKGKAVEDQQWDLVFFVNQWVNSFN
jgi:hypothetical protein